jgi:hypothetical protein
VQLVRLQFKYTRRRQHTGSGSFCYLVCCTLNRCCANKLPIEISSYRSLRDHLKWAERAGLKGKMNPVEKRCDTDFLRYFADIDTNSHPVHEEVIREHTPDRVLRFGANVNVAPQCIQKS